MWFPTNARRHVPLLLVEIGDWKCQNSLPTKLHMRRENLRSATRRHRQDSSCTYSFVKRGARVNYAVPSDTAAND
jgi:hypothetical protein